MHVRDVRLERADDESIWQYAAEHALVIVTKDADFRQRSFLAFNEDHETAFLALG